MQTRRSFIPSALAALAGLLPFSRQAAQAEPPPAVHRGRVSLPEEEYEALARDAGRFRELQRVAGEVQPVQVPPNAETIVGISFPVMHEKDGFIDPILMARAAIAMHDEIAFRRIDVDQPGLRYQLRLTTGVVQLEPGHSC